MKIAIVDRYFYPDLQATAVYLTEIARFLAERHDVTVYCAPPSGFRASDQHHLGKERLVVKTVFGFSFSKRFIALRILNYISFIISCFLTVLFAPKPDVLMVQTTPPLNSFFVALAALLRRMPLVYVINDLFPETALGTGTLKDGFLVRLFRAMNRFAMFQAKRVIVIGSDMRKRFICLGVSPEKIRLIRYWANLDQIVPTERRNRFSEEEGLLSHFVVMHAGNLGLVHGLELLMETAWELRNESHIFFVLVGDGTVKQRLMEFASEKRLGNVRFIHFMPPERLSEVLASADLHLISLAKGLWGLSLPSKLYSVLASQRAVLASVERESDAAELILEAQAGVVCSSFSARDLASQILRLSKMPEELVQMGYAGRKFLEKNRFRENGLKAYEAVLQEAAKGDG